MTDDVLARLERLTRIESPSLDVQASERTAELLTLEPLRPLFEKNVSLHGALAPARAYIETLMGFVLDGAIDPSRVFDLAIPLNGVADGYAAMDERRAIKVILDATAR